MTMQIFSKTKLCNSLAAADSDSTAADSDSAAAAAGSGQRTLQVCRMLIAASCRIVQDKTTSAGRCCTKVKGQSHFKIFRNIDSTRVFPFCQSVLCVLYRVLPKNTVLENQPFVMSHGALAKCGENSLCLRGSFWLIISISRILRLVILPLISVSGERSLNGGHEKTSDFTSLSHLNQSYVTAPCRLLPGTGMRLFSLAKTLISIQPAALCPVSAGRPAWNRSRK